MNNKHKHSGFSLTEILLSIGILTIGMIFIAGVFPVGIHFATVSTERTLSAVIADEAFAKIKLIADDPNCEIYANDFSIAYSSSFQDIVDYKRPNATPPVLPIDPDELSYPSIDTDITDKQYYWSAICRRIGPYEVQATVFVCRKAGVNQTYHHRDPNSPDSRFFTPWFYPVPVPVQVTAPPIIDPDEDELLIIDCYPPDDPEEITFINDGYTIVDSETGRLLRVLERYADDPGTGMIKEDEIILLDQPWPSWWSLPRFVWVIPPPVNGGRNPCIGVFQKVIKF